MAHSMEKMFGGRQLTALIVCCAIIVSGCAQYKRPTLMIKVPEFYPSRTKISQLAIVADPYFETSKMEYLFNSNLLDEGFLAIHFIAFNYGVETYDLSKARFVLVRDDGLEFVPAEPKLVAKKVLKHTSLRMIGWGFAGLIILSIPFSMAAGIDSFRANKSTRKMVAQETLTVFKIEGKEEVDGFYFFQIGRRSKEIRQALTHKYRLRIEGFRDVQTEKQFEFIIGLN